MRRLRIPATSLVLCCVGLGILLSAVARDPLGTPIAFGFTARQVMGSLLGGGILVVGALLATRIATGNAAKIRWLAALYFAVCAAIAVWYWPMQTASWALLGYVAAGCVLLPGVFGAVSLAAIVALHFLLTWVTDLKVGLTGLPLTVLDLEIALRNPAGLWDALSLPQWTRYVTTLVLTLVLLSWLAAGIVGTMNVIARRGWRTERGAIVTRCVSLCFLAALLSLQLDALYAAAAKDDSPTWQLEGVVRLAKTMGVLPFIAYSEHLESASTGDIYLTSNVAPPGPEQITAAVSRYMDFTSRPEPGTRLRPNILVLLAESTFDPGKVFRLQGPWNDYLFKPDPRTAALGLLRVNAMGGGTWITEFETIVGMDSRVFGYAGMYTHASLSPFVDRSIATYLRDHGYHTWAFFPHGGDFYNARNAYRHYGFETILDSIDMGRGPWMDSDRTVAASVVTALGPAPPAPFFGYALFIENHSPHQCRGTDARRFKVHFAGTKDFTPNCALDEYLRRLGSTTAAIKALADYLKDIEARTGRPFVLLVFGDHQPHTFSSTGGFQYDYRPLRVLADTRTTFFHIWSSDPYTRLHCCSEAPPAAMLPTLLSGFVATSADDVYLGINAWLYDHCGSDAIRRDFQEFMSRMGKRVVDRRTSSCKAAYEGALSWYRTAGVMRLGGDSATRHAAP